MPMSQVDKAVRFQKLHQSTFVIPNPWDAGSARLLAALGFEALATTSAGFALTLAKRDGALTRDEALAHSAAIVAATDLPVSADLEKGYADAPADVARTVSMAGASGLVGCSIEDATGDPKTPIFDKAFAVERIKAAVAAARALQFPFTLTARSENFVRGRPDLGDTIARLQAFEAAGADVLYAPGLPDMEAVQKVCSSVKRPVNVMIGARHADITVAQLAAVGVKRISLGPTLMAAAMGEFLRAAREMKDKGSFSFVKQAASFGELFKLMAP